MEQEKEFSGRIDWARTDDGSTWWGGKLFYNGVFIKQIPFIYGAYKKAQERLDELINNTKVVREVDGGVYIKYDNQETFYYGTK